MLIHVNTSPPGSWALRWGSRECHSLPRKRQLQVEQLLSSVPAPAAPFTQTQQPTHPHLQWDSLHRAHGRRQSPVSRMKKWLLAWQTAGQPTVALRWERRKLRSLLVNAREQGLLPLEEQVRMTLDFQRLLENRSFT